MHAFENTILSRGKYHPKELEGGVSSAYISLGTVYIPKSHRGKLHNSWSLVRILRRGLLKKCGIISPRLNAALVPPNKY